MRGSGELRFGVAVGLAALLLTHSSPAAEPERAGGPAVSERFSALIGSWSDDDRTVVIKDVKPDGSIEGSWLGFANDLNPARPLLPGSKAYVDWRGRVRVKLRLSEGGAEGFEYDEYELRDGALVTEIWGGLPGRPLIIRLEKEGRSR